METLVCRNCILKNNHQQPQPHNRVTHTHTHTHTATGHSIRWYAVPTGLARHDAIEKEIHLRSFDRSRTNLTVHAYILSWVPLAIKLKKKEQKQLDPKPPHGVN